MKLYIIKNAKIQASILKLKYSLSFLFFIAPIISFSQVEAKAEINIIVNDFFQLTSQKIDGQRVDMIFKNSNDFTNGISTLKQSHLLLSSTVYYNLVARAALENFRSGSHLTFPASVVKLEVDNTDVKAKDVILNSIEELQTNNQPLITNGHPNLYKNINIKYSISPEKSQQHILRAGPGTYSNTVIYTLTSR